MRLTILLVVVIAAAAVTAVKLSKSTNDNRSAKEKVDRVMDAVSDHCDAKRRKRQVGPSSEDKVRRLILDVVKDCLDEEDGPVSPPPIDGPCSSPATVNLTEWWRQDNNGSDHQPDGYNCDDDLQNNATWFRITGGAGKYLRDSCVPSYSCGSWGGFWTDAEMPTEVGEIRQVPIYGSWRVYCNWYTWPAVNALTVQRCSSRDGDFVYKVDGTQSCNWSFCTME